ncbi:palmitoyltransferase swf1 [Lecanicillium sp. MT-2017a]|nr:palmitoyltransferase swf1 [Lecanicillium sp. MT-2017a]
MYFGAWGWVMQRDVRLGATTLLAGLTSPLVWGLLFYTLYHVYCGTTTNESLKWSDMAEDMADGYAFTRSMPRSRARDFRIEPACPRWPVEPEQVLIATHDGEPPVTGEGRPPLAGDGAWDRIWKLKNAENMYDLGFWDNMADIFVRNYSFELRRRAK